MTKISIESSYHPNRQQYHLDGASRDCRFPRQRWFDSHAEMIEAVERVNPGVEIV